MNIIKQKCILHSNPYQYFCQKCNQPICKDCTYLGPHNTQTHRVSQLSSAYQKRVFLIRQRILYLINHSRSHILQLIDQQNNNIHNLQHQKKSIQAQNQKFKAKSIANLIQQYQHNSHQITQLSQNLTQYLNQINDIGHSYQNLKTTLQKVVAFQKILADFKQIIDKLEIVISRKLQIKSLPKQNTDIRVSLNKLQSLEVLYLQKIKSISQILELSKKQIKNFKKPEIKYQQLLKHLQLNMKDNSQYIVCHFCGLPFSYDTSNKQCSRNKVAMNLQFAKFSGFCKNVPQSARYGTYRHYFSQAKDLKYHFRQVYEKQMKDNNFYVILQSLILKVNSLQKINNVNLKKELIKIDKQNKGNCDRIVIQYYLLQLCKMRSEQVDILISVFEKKGSNGGDFQYLKFLQMMQKMQISMD